MAGTLNNLPAQPVSIVPADLFRAVREQVPARLAAEHYGFRPNRSGFLCCPFHREKTASLKFYDNGSWYCFGCGRGGSCIDFTAALLDLEPLEAAERLNADFGLNLPFRRKPTRAERQAARRRREVADISQRFQSWREEMLRQLTACHRAGHAALQALAAPEDLDRLRDAQAAAIRNRDRFAQLAEDLTSGSLEVQMAVFRQREEVNALCARTLNATPTKSSEA